MIRGVLIISISLLFYSCKDSLPSGIIHQNKMQEILWDVLRADALSQQSVKSNSTTTLADETLSLTRKVFLIHNITEEEFKKSYSYYTHHSDLMRNMLDSLNAQKINNNNIEIPVKRKRFW